MGMATAAKLSNAELVFSGYPITPASDILHDLSKYKHFGVTTFQAEDEIAAAGVALGGVVVEPSRPRGALVLGGDLLGA